MVSPFAMLYGPVIVDPLLSAGAMRLYALLWCLGDRFKQGWHSQKLLADLLHITDRTIRNGLQNLIEAGLIITTVRRPKPTLVQIVDPAEVYGDFMVRFYTHIHIRSAALRQEGVDPEIGESNRKNSSGSIGKDFPTKDIKGSRSKDTRDAARGSRGSVDDVEKRLNDRRKKSPAKKSTPSRKKKFPGLRIPSLKPLSPSRWGGGKFYVHALECASIKGVPVRDPHGDFADIKRSRLGTEMGRVLKVYEDKGYTKRQFADLVTMIFENWADFSGCFRKGQFSVYDMRYSRAEICQIERRITEQSDLEDLEDFEEGEERPKLKGQVFYD